MSGAVHVTHHAIDRVGERVRDLWLRSGLGVATFTQKLADEGWAGGLHVPASVGLPGGIQAASRRRRDAARYVLDGRVLLVFATDRRTRLVTLYELDDSDAKRLRLAIAAAARLNIREAPRRRRTA